MRTLLQDIVFALRLFRKNPGLTAIAAISLALGIGANTAMFSFTDAIMFRPLPVAKPDELVRVFTNMIAVTIAACWLPARRAAKVDPMIALRYE